VTLTRLYGIAAAAAGMAALAGRCQSTAPASAALPMPPSGTWQFLDVRDYGAVADGVTDNTAAFAAVADAVNRSPPRSAAPATVLFPPGTYAYAGGLVFSAPVRLSGAGATLDYRGRDEAVKLGPDGLSLRTYANHLNYAVEGLTFTGGAAMTQGIYFNTFVTQPRVSGAAFVNFGGGRAYAIWFQSQNWDARVSDARFYADDGNVHQLIRANGIATDGTSDMGQSRLTVSNILAKNRATAGGQVVGIYTNGFNASITNSRIEGFSPGIQVGANGGASSAFTHIDLVYMEVDRGAYPCILYGEADGPYRASPVDNLSVARSYCTVHDTELGATAGFLGPAGPSSGLRGAVVSDNVVSGASPGSPLVFQNDVPLQEGNTASRNFGAGAPARRIGLLHSAGSRIAPWAGPDERPASAGEDSEGPGSPGIRP